MSSLPAVKRRVLVVDDAPEIVELVTGLLRKEGFDGRPAPCRRAGVAVGTLIGSEAAPPRRRRGRLVRTDSEADQGVL